MSARYFLTRVSSKYRAPLRHETWNSRFSDDQYPRNGKRHDKGQPTPCGYGCKPKGKPFQGKTFRAKSEKGKRVPRAPPPKPGEPEIKFIDGKKRYWCSKCNQWTESHGTGSLKTKEQLQAEQNQPQANVAMVDFDMHPAVFRLTSAEASPPDAYP